ncbi:MAG TPA: hypothetical protein VII52_12475, partial [Gemmatimonadaceae bacterium]
REAGVTVNSLMNAHVSPRVVLAVALLVLAAPAARAQAGMLSNAKAKAQQAVAASNAHTAAEQNLEPAPKPAPQAPKQSVANAPAPAPQHAAQLDRPGTKLDIATVDSSGPPPTIMRELYEYPRDGRRDPFISLLTTNELRPTMSDLRLTGILFDQSGSHSVATLRDVMTNAQYRVSTGTALGRMRVSAIRVKTVVFTIDEFGTTRQDSLVLGDSTKVRK